MLREQKRLAGVRLSFRSKKRTEHPLVDRFFEKRVAPKYKHPVHMGFASLAEVLAD